MADQFRWWKLWCDALGDQDLDNLSNEVWACWAKFGLYTRAHGTDGTIRLAPPSRALQNHFRARSFEDVLLIVLRFPNILVATGPIRWPHGRDKRPVLERGEWVRLAGVAGGVLLVSEEGGPGVNVTPGGIAEVCVSWRNWSKYQSDSTAPRQRRRRGSQGVGTGFSSRSKRRGEEIKKQRGVAHGSETARAPDSPGLCPHGNEWEKCEQCADDRNRWAASRQQAEPIGGASDMRTGRPRTIADVVAQLRAKESKG